MANLASGDVTTVRTWYEWVNPFRRRTCKLVRAAITGAGTTTDTARIPASAFGLTEFEEISLMVKDDNSLVYYAAPSYDRQYIVIPNVISGTATAHATPAAITGTFQFIVKGR